MQVAPIIRKYAVHFVAGGALTAFLVVSVLYWLERRDRFPVIEPGLYTGTVRGLYGAQGLDEVPLLIEQVAGADQLIISIVHAGLQPKVLVGLNPEKSTESILPVTLESDDQSIRFIGKHAGERRYSGIVRDLQSQREGRWEVAPVMRGDTSLTPQKQEQLKLWLKLKEELENTRLQARELEMKLPEQKKEIERLSSALAESEKLKSTAQEKFLAIQKEVEAAQGELRKKQARAKQLEEKLLLSQQITGMGRLVSLVHQAAEREGRWFESMLRASSDSSSPEVDVAAEKGEKVLQLQEEIRKEKDRINQLSVAQGVP